MKRNISDLLDAYIDESVDLNGTSLLSSSRIKELTLSRINQKNTATMLEQGGQGRIRKLLSRCLLIAAIIALLCCITAFAIVFSLRDAARMISFKHFKRL